MVNQDDKDHFDVPMGCCDRAKVCKFFCTYLINQMKVVIAKENIGIYGDDGLGILKTSVDLK